MARITKVSRGRWAGSIRPRPAGDRGCRECGVDRHRKAAVGQPGSERSLGKSPDRVQALPCPEYSQERSKDVMPRKHQLVRARHARTRARCGHPPAREGGAGEEAECRSWRGGGVSVMDTHVRPRLCDVAEQAGVSSATASRVLTGSARVRPETRRQVEKVMARLGYVRNRAAHSSAQRRTGSIAFVVCEDNSRVFSEPFFQLMLRSGSRELLSQGIQPVLLTAHSPRDQQIASGYLRSGQVDGAVRVSRPGRRPRDTPGLDVPSVLAGRPFRNDASLSYVDADNVGGAKMAVRYLLKGGRKTVATVAGPADISPGVDRFRGYRMPMADPRPSPSGLIMFRDFC